VNGIEAKAIYALERAITHALAAVAANKSCSVGPAAPANGAISLKPKRDVWSIKTTLGMTYTQSGSSESPRSQLLENAANWHVQS
jgi:hypothetical protein